MHGGGESIKKAIDRWKIALESICGSYSRAIPENWRKRSIEECDESFIKNKIVSHSLVEGLGSDYMPVRYWLVSLKEMPVMHTHCTDRYKEEVASYFKTLDDVVVIVAVMLSYNCLHFKFPKVDAEKRRTALKELRRTVKGKFGKDVEIPGNISDRLQAAISGK